MRKITLKILFILVLILAENAIIFADVTHPLHAPDTPCDICLAAHHVSGGILPTLPVVAPSLPEIFHPQWIETATLQPRFRVYLSRAPPPAS